jgi:protein-S-isoprenylcysteine O-methyltransferase Ste14
MVGSSEASSPLPWPPIVYGFGALVASILTWFYPVSLWTPVTHGWRIAGVGVIAAGLLLLALAGRQFHRTGTPVPPIKPTTAIVTTGIYQYTRNPMYLGLSLIVLGLAVLTASLWFFLATPVAVVAVTKLAIEREEIYLERKFGAVYRTYKQRVRRWL